MGKKAKPLKVDKDVPLPYSDEAEDSGTRMDEIARAVNTAELLAALGEEESPPDMDKETFDEASNLVKDVVLKGKVENLAQPGVVHGARAFLTKYGESLALDVGTARSALTNKLMTLADCGDARIELKAIEMLGKHSDIGLFTERSEVTVNYNSPEQLEKEILQRVNRLIKAQEPDVPLVSDSLDSLLDEALVEEAEFTEIPADTEGAEGVADTNTND